MSKRTALAAGWALLAAVGIAAQDRGGGGGSTDLRCDLKVKKTVSWCTKCDKYVAPDKTKDHGECGKLGKALVCIKTYYEGCHKGKQTKPYKC